MHTESDEFERSQATLKAEIAGLQARAATLDEILVENSRLRANWLAQSAQYGYGHKTSEDDHVHRTVYQALSAKYQESVTNLHKANQVGQKYRDEAKALHERRQRDKQAIKSWQQYHDQLMNKKRNAHHDLQDLIVAIESPPLLQAERYGTDGYLSHSMPCITSPPGTAGSIEEQSMVPTPARTSVAEQQRTERSQEMDEGDRGEQATEPGPIDEPAGVIDGGDHEDYAQNASAQDLGNDWEKGKPNCTRLEPGGSDPVTDLPSLYEQSPARGPVIRSSQSTDGENALSVNNTPVKKDDLPTVQSDEPEIVSIRSAKRKRTASRADSKKSKAELVLIKSEIGSSPMHDSAVNHLNHTESVDLDEVTAAFTTPRKRMKITRRSLQLSPQGDGHDRQRHQSLPPAIERHLSAGSRGDSDISPSQRSPNIPPRHFGTHVQKRSIRPRATDVDEEEAQHEQSATALRHLDVNRPLTPRSERLKKTGSKYRRGSRGVVIQDFAEDGEQYSRRYADQPMQREKAAVSSTFRPLVPKRLNALLEASSSPNRKILTPASNLMARNERLGATGGRTKEAPTYNHAFVEQSYDNDPVESAKNATGQLHHGCIAQAPRSENPLSVGRARLRNFNKLETLISPIKGTITASYPESPLVPRSAHATTTKRQSVADKAPLVLPQIGKLKTPSNRLRPPSSHGQSVIPDSIRNKAISELKPHDFRVNTEANFGHDHAFTDVVRNHDNRRCLPGCTKPECCGEHFRKMVELGGLKPAARGMFEPTSSQESPDDRLLRDYMGYNAGVIPSLSKEEREELLSKARTEELSKKISRHRAQWERAKSPPGFWKTDFPTTQEATDYKSEASKREVAEVLERRREAMRPGGKWKFADEC